MSKKGTSTKSRESNSHEEATDYQIVCIYLTNSDSPIVAGVSFEEDFVSLHAPHRIVMTSKGIMLSNLTPFNPTDFVEINYDIVAFVHPVTDSLHDLYLETLDLSRFNDDSLEKMIQVGIQTTRDLVEEFEKDEEEETNEFLSKHRIKKSSEAIPESYVSVETALKNFENTPRRNKRKNKLN